MNNKENEIIRVTKKIDTSVLQLPELEPYFGKDVEITITITVKDDNREYLRDQLMNHTTEMFSASFLDPEARQRFLKSGLYT